MSEKGKVLIHRKYSKRFWLLLLLVGYFGIAYALMQYFDISCVFLHFFGIPCPGCGMTRALFALMRLDFLAAAKYNVMIFFMPYIFVYIFLDCKHKIHDRLLVGIAATAGIYWIYRLIQIF